MKKRIAQVVVGLPVEGPFDYSIDQEFRDRVAVGDRVYISFNRRNRIGFIIGLKQSSSFKRLNPILSLLDDEPSIDAKALQLTKTMSEYYGCSWGEAIETYLPTVLRKKKPIQAYSSQTISQDKRHPGQVTLLHDVTLSKRWPYLISQIKEVLAQRQSVIFLVPEISLIDDIKQKLDNPFDCPKIILDKKKSPQKELEQWLQIKRGEASIIVGTRSGVFAPAPRLGLIIVYDEDNDAYKQEQTPHYHVRQIAQMRAKIDKSSVLYVSSAPSAEIWEHCKKQKWSKVVYQKEILNDLQIIDMTNYNPRKTSILSYPLQIQLEKFLKENKKILLYFNRKGFSTLTRCNQCGRTLRCERCDVNLTYLYSKKMMVCRHCNFTMILPKVCPQCQSSYLRSMGIGNEKLESELARHYPDAKVLFYDKEHEILPLQADIVIATRAITKILDRISFGLIAVLDFDAEIHHHDFRSAHKAFALLVQLRQSAKEKLLVQSRLADNYSLKAAKKMDFDFFYKKELNFRKELGLPPYRHIISIGLRGVQEEIVFEQSQDLFDKFNHNLPQEIEISDPHPEGSPKLRDQYRYAILVKTKSVKKALEFIHPIIKGFKKHNCVIAVNVDP